MPLPWQKKPVKTDPVADAMGGLRALTAATLLQPHAGLIQRIRLTSGVSDQKFDTVFLPIIEIYAQLVQLLPASINDYYTAPGGLLNKGLETGFIALQSSDARIFTVRETSKRRRTQEPRWRAASFIGGLFYHCGWVSTGLKVVSDAGNTWNPLTKTLGDWVSFEKTETYYLNFLPGEQSGNNEITSFLLQKYIPVAALDYLTEEGPDILVNLLRTMSDALDAQDPDTLLTVVRQSEQAVIDRDRRQRLGNSSVAGGIAVDVYLIDAMRELLRARWTVNDKDSVVFLTKRGLFIEWERASEDIKQHLRQSNTPGIPNHPDTLVDCLSRTGFINPHAPTHSHYWKITVQHESGSMDMDAIQIAHPELLLKHENPALLDITVHGENQSPLPGKKNAAEEGRPNHQQVVDDDMQEPDAPIVAKEVALEEQTGERPPPDGPLSPNPHRKATDRINRWFEQQGEVGRALLSLVMDINSGKRVLGSDVFWAERGLAVCYPESLQGYGLDESAIANECFTKDWLERDPVKSMARVQTVVDADGQERRVLLLKREIGEKIVQAAGKDLEQFRANSKKPDSNKPTSAPVKPEENQAGKPSLNHFFQAIHESHCSGGLPFELSANDSVVIAPYPEIFSWFMEMNKGVNGKELIKRLMGRDLIVSDGGVVWHTDNGRKTVWFRSTCCTDLHRALTNRDIDDE